MEHPRLGRRASTRAWTIGPSAAAPAWCSCPSRCSPRSRRCRQQAAEPGLLILLTPAGERLTQPLVQELASHKRLLLLCGRYEGFDERIRLGLQPREISIGDFVCNGGEVPAMVVIDTVIRYVPGVLGDAESVAEESHNDPGRLEYPQYTRPRVFRGMAVPDMLLSGDHEAIARWRQEQSAGPQPARPARRERYTQRRRKVSDHEESIDRLWWRRRRLKNDVPQFEIGDTVDVHSAHPGRQEGARAGLQRHGDRPPRRAACARCSRSAASCRARASSASSRCTRRRSPRSR